jgi:hypothetical protein
LILISVSDFEQHSGDGKNPSGCNPASKCTLVTAERAELSGYNEVKLMNQARTSWFLLSTPERSLACWVDFLVCPRRFLAVLPSHARANLFAGD